MSDHFTRLSLGPPLGDEQLDLCDLYAIDRLGIDNDGGRLNDIAVSFAYAPSAGGCQTLRLTWTAAPARWGTRLPAPGLSCAPGPAAPLITQQSPTGPEAWRTSLRALRGSV